MKHRKRQKHNLYFVIFIAKTLKNVFLSFSYIISNVSHLNNLDKNNLKMRHLKTE